MPQAKPEQDLSNAIRLAVGSLPDVRLFRNNTGTIKDSRGIPVTFGLMPGSADLIGIVSPHGRFLSIEVKRPGANIELTDTQWQHVHHVRYLRLGCRCARCHRASQQDWRDMVNTFGGVAGIVDNVADALALVEVARRDPAAELTKYLGGFHMRPMCRCPTCGTDH
jgi:hypothetical protein